MEAIAETEAQLFVYCGCFFWIIACCISKQRHLEQVYVKLDLRVPEGGNLEFGSLLKRMEYNREKQTVHQAKRLQLCCILAHSVNSSQKPIQTCVYIVTFLQRTYNTRWHVQFLLHSNI